MNANVRVDKKRYIFINLSVTQLCFSYIVKEHFLTILQYCMTSKLTEWQGFWLVTSFIAILTMLWLNHCYGCCWNYLGSSHLIWGYNACFPDFTKLTLCLLATKKENYQPLTILTSDFQGFLKDKIFQELSLPPLWRTEEQIKEQKHREEREIRAIYLTKNILQIQVFRWYEKLNRNLA